MEKIRGLWKLPNGRDSQRGKLGLVLMGGAMLSKSLLQFSVVETGIKAYDCSRFKTSLGTPSFSWAGN